MTVRRRDITIFGVLNVTEDSFSDGGHYLAADDAVRKGLELVAQGADVVDVGAASSHPEAAEVFAEEEIARLAPVVAALVAEGVAVSIDSWRPEVQRWALDRGVAWLNDIRGFPHPSLLGELAASKVGLVAMHSVTGGGRAVRDDVDASTVLARIDGWFAEKRAAIFAAGIAAERVVFDPGMGLFLGSDPEASLAVLRSYGRWCGPLAGRVMVAVSRKSVIGRLTGKPVAERTAGSLAAEVFAIEQGARFVRTHEPGALADFLAVREKLESDESP
jgi:dihydropteroate synthase type 2